MQPDELKELRKALGLSQQEFADALGVSRVLVGQMERGQAPIERRTALAVHQLANQHARLTSNHEVTELANDIPLATAQVIWDRYGKIDPPVKVIGIAGQDDGRYPSSSGACNAEWQCADDVGRLLRLFTLFVDLTVDEKIPAALVHEAFSVIPEYRKAMHLMHFREGVAP